MKKLLLVLSLAFMLVLSPVSAIDTSIPSVICIIYDDNGNSYEITPELIETNTVLLREATPILTSTYNMAIPANILYGNSNLSGADDSNCASVNLTTYFYKNDGYTPNAYNLYGASGSYSITDPNVTSWTANLNFFYAGQSVSTGMWAQDSRTIYNVGSSFNHNSGFTEYVVPISGYLDQIGSSLTFNFTMGTRTFTGEFKVPVK